MLFPNEIIELIADCAMYADADVRGELALGVVTSEPDYTTSFTRDFRKYVNRLRVPGLSATIQTLTKRNEVAFGADACVVFQNQKESKVGIFEAKLPRFDNKWDSIQASSGGSHFDSQLLRQTKLRPHFAVWEMFYCNFDYAMQPHYMPDFVSACVWHDHAYKKSLKRRGRSRPWTDSQLKNLLRGKMLTIDMVVREICECSQGKLVPLGDELKAFGEAELPHILLVISYTPDTPSPGGE